jgi:hypothetical protein
MPLFHNKIKNTLSFHVLNISDLNLEIFTMQLAQPPSANKTKRVKKKIGSIFGVLDFGIAQYKS